MCIRNTGSLVLVIIFGFSCVNTKKINNKIVAEVKNEFYKFKIKYKHQADTICLISDVEFRFDEYVHSINEKENKRRNIKKLNSYFKNYTNLIDSFLNSSYPSAYRNYSVKQVTTYLAMDIYLKYRDGMVNGIDNRHATSDMATVRIKVLDNNGVELAGYKPFIRPFLSLENIAIIRFNPTNNAIRNDITPAWYLVWIEKDGRKIESSDRHIPNVDSTIPIVIEFVISK